MAASSRAPHERRRIRARLPECPGFARRGELWWRVGQRPAVGGRLQRRPVALAERERLDQRAQGVALRRAVHPTFQRTDRPRTDARAFRQLLLRETGRDWSRLSAAPKCSVCADEFMSTLFSRLGQ
jgi:hypothetical protein